MIDWPDACRGDVCRFYLLLRLHASALAAPYLDVCLGGISRQMILDWLPYVAAARLVEKFPGETDGLSEILTLRNILAKPPTRLLS
jgi:hypothetical protein